ncbi:MAG: response regulator receiver protein [Atopobiaceae bacterium]|nr:response regulator receiver protein [Atopobiaceae bacterium]
MACDPRREDYLRLGLRFARTLNEGDPFASVRASSSFSRRYAYNREGLPQSDADRAFHLVAEATDLIDYQLPFASEDAVEQLFEGASALLEEAVALDAHCHDARRMLGAAESSSFESYYRFLADGAEEVREDCERARTSSDNLPESQRRLAQSLSMLPFLRWRASEASRALICGHYTKAAKICEELLSMERTDPCDVRFTYALALAKLEDDEQLDLLARQCEQTLGRLSVINPWMLLARLSLTFKQLNEKAALGYLDRILHLYPHAAIVLSNQDELPDGVFARLAVAPFSEDELILAVSEASVLLQEGRSMSPKGALGSWLSNQPRVKAALDKDPRYNHRLSAAEQDSAEQASQDEEDPRGRSV